MPDPKDRICLRTGSYAALVAAGAAGKLLPREAWLVPPGLANAGLYVGNPADPALPPVPLSGSLNTPQSVTVVPSDSPTENAALLQLAVEAAAELTPNGEALSATNRASVFVLPGMYDFGTGGELLLADPYIDIIGLGPNPLAVWIKSTHNTGGHSKGTIRQTAANIGLYNLTAEIDGSNSDASAYCPDSDRTGTVLDNIRLVATGTSQRPTRVLTGATMIFPGSYRRVVTSAWNLFNTADPRMTGECIECEGGPGSFRHSNASGGGRWIRCKATIFGTSGGSSFDILSGYVRDCEITSANGDWETPSFGGRMEGCRIVAQGTNKTAIDARDGASFYNCTIIGTGSGKSIGSASGSAISVKIAHCRMNLGLGTNVTNALSDACNVIDSDIA